MATACAHAEGAACRAAPAARQTGRPCRAVRTCGSRPAHRTRASDQTGRSRQGVEAEGARQVAHTGGKIEAPHARQGEACVGEEAPHSAQERVVQPQPGACCLPREATGRPRARIFSGQADSPPLSHNPFQHSEHVRVCLRQLDTVRRLRGAVGVHGVPLIRDGHC